MKKGICIVIVLALVSVAGLWGAYSLVGGQETDVQYVETPVFGDRETVLGAMLQLQGSLDNMRGEMSDDQVWRTDLTLEEPNELLTAAGKRSLFEDKESQLEGLPLPVVNGEMTEEGLLLRKDGQRLFTAALHPDDPVRKAETVLGAWDGQRLMLWYDEFTYFEYGESLPRGSFYLSIYNDDGTCYGARFDSSFAVDGTIKGMWFWFGPSLLLGMEPWQLVML